MPFAPEGSGILASILVLLPQGSYALTIPSKLKNDSKNKDRKKKGENWRKHLKIFCTARNGLLETSRAHTTDAKSLHHGTVSYTSTVDHVENRSPSSSRQN